MPENSAALAEAPIPGDKHHDPFWLWALAVNKSDQDHSTWPGQKQGASWEFWRFCIDADDSLTGYLLVNLDF